MPYLLLLFVLLSTWNAAIAWTSAREPRMLKTTRIASFHSRSDAPSPSRFQQFSVTKLQKALATIITTSGVALALQGPHAAIAAVGEGDLPAGPLAQMKVLKLKDEWASVVKSLQARGKEVTSKELLNTQMFIKRFGNEYVSLDLLSRSIQDPARQAEAKALTNDFRKLMRQADKALTEDNVDGVFQVYPQTQQDIEKFFALLSDVPDEL